MELLKPNGVFFVVVVVRGILEATLNNADPCNTEHTSWRLASAELRLDKREENSKKWASANADWLGLLNNGG